MIDVRGLDYSYPSSSGPALSGIDLSVPQGAMFGLLGPNGAGKTTLLSLLCGLLPSPPGTITISGHDLASSRGRSPHSGSLVPQHLAFYPTLTVIENLRFFAGVQGLNAADADERIEAVATIAALVERLEDRADRLSGGLQRRLNLAIGLLSRPRLLFLDEPTVGIDPHSRRFILDTIRRLRDDGATVVYTSHYMDEVEYLCDDIAIIDRGSVLVSGPLEQLLQDETGERRNLETLFLARTKRSLRDG